MPIRFLADTVAKRNYLVFGAAGLTGILLGGLLGTSAAVLLSMALSPRGGFDTIFWLFITTPLLALAGAVMGVRRALHLLHWVYREAASRGRRAVLVPVAAHLIGAPLIAATIFFGAWLCSLPPRDTRLLAHFQQHRAELEQIVRMAQKDRSQTVGSTYRHYPEQAGAPLGLRATKTGDEVDIFYFVSGSAVSSDTLKGFAYRRTPPAALRESLDPCNTGCRNTAITYRHIEGNWYLFYQYVPG